MKIARVIVVGVMLSNLGPGALEAQTLRDATPPAEFPPASFKGNQYVDSRGCVYIRAGIDGNVTWVPRVTRQRELVCGYRPTLGPNSVAAAASPQPAPSPQPSTRPAATAAAASAAAPAQTTTRPAVKPAPAVVAAATATPRPPKLAPAGPRTADQLPESTRVVPRHVYDNRQNTTNFQVPKGYRPVWTDDRLNTKRTERTLRPSIVTGQVKTPRGQKNAWDDGRLNPNRGPRSTQGNTQTDEIWTQTVPRTLAPVPTKAKVYVVSDDARSGNSAFWQPIIQTAEPAPTVTRLSTRSQPKAPKTELAAGKPIYIRVAAYAKNAEARATAKAFARKGLPMHLGEAKRGGATQHVVLSGPFDSPNQARTALAQVRKSGFSAARLLR